MTITDLLIQFGLSEKEAQLYLFLLRNGASNPATIAKRSDLPRSTAKYQAEELVKKGFARSANKAGSALYTPVKPEQLFTLLERRREEANTLEHHLLNSMETLLSLCNPQAHNPKISYYEGVDGVQELLQYMVNSPSALVSFGAGDYFREYYPELTEHFRSKAYDTYQDIRVLRCKKYKELHTKDPSHIQTRYFAHLEELTVDIQVRDDKMSIISVDKGSPTGILIEHPTITAGFRGIFEELWETSRP